MKKILFPVFCALFAATVFSVQAFGTDADGHQLTALWRVYAEALAADKPLDQLSALQQIERTAARKRCVWDYYDALSTIVSVRSAINWKDREPARQEMKDKIESFGEPILVFFLRKGAVSGSDLRAYVQAQRARLQAAHNPALYARDGTVQGMAFSQALLPMLDNDYAYALWSMGNEQDLLEYYGGRYPFRAFVEYRRPHCDKADFARRYAGKAVSLLARQDMLRMKFDDAEDYRALRQEAVRLARERDAFTGSEAAIARCCRYPEELIRTLDAPSLSLHSAPDTLLIVLRNLPAVELSILREGSPAETRRLSNPSRRYYEQDTLAFPFPASLPDDDYQIVCRAGKLEETYIWNKYSLSIASRRDADGDAVFITDACTGEPLDACTLEVLDDDPAILTRSAGLSLSGFTRVPADLVSGFEKGLPGLSLRARDAGGRRSKAIRLFAPQAHPDKPSSGCQALLLTDRAAFHPDEIVQVKAILYQECQGERFPAAGQDCELRLLAPDGEVLDTRVLHTNDLGSAVSSFRLVPAGRGGAYTIMLYCGDKYLDSKTIMVDDFVLPSFTLEWETDDMYAVAGDTLRFRGQVRSFSGHPLAEARAWYAVNWQEADPLILEADGHFVISVPTESGYSRGISLEVRVADGTGETQSFHTYATVLSELSLSISLENPAEGQVWGPSGSEVALLSGERAQVRFAAPLGALSYRLLRDDEVLAEGRAGHDALRELDFSGLPDGYYVLEATVRACRDAGQELVRREKLTLLKVAPDSDVLPVPLPCFFRKLDAENGLAVQLGSDGPLWVSVEVFGEDKRLLESRVVRLDGGWGHSKSLQTFRYILKPGDSGRLSVKLLCFRDRDSRAWEAEFEPSRPSCLLPVEWTCFKDSTLPGHRYTFSLHTQKGAECAVAIYDQSTETICGNGWQPLAPPYLRKPRVYYQVLSGSNQGNRILRGGDMLYYGIKGRADMSFRDTDGLAVEEAVPESLVVNQPEMGSVAISVREDFAATVAWEPQLVAGADGFVHFSFRNADKLATFRVQAFVHDKNMATGTLRREMLVTLPGRVDIVAPRQLYSGDHYVARVNVTSLVPRDVPGELTVQFMDGGDRRKAALLRSVRVPVCVPASGGVMCKAEIDVPAGLDTLGILAVCEGRDPEFGADAIWVTVPVCPPAQTITEAHSALLPSNASRDSLRAVLAGLFLNVDAKTASVRERDIRQLVQAALPERIVPKSENALDLADALYAVHLLRSRCGVDADCDEASLYRKLFACRRPDGGFGWFEGLSSSPLVTSVVLRRLQAVGKEGPEMRAAVCYLDSCQFAKPARPAWCGGLSLPQYLEVRSLFPQVPFGWKYLDKKEARTFRKEVKAYLLPAGPRGLDGALAAKARRVRILTLLTASDGGKALAGTWKLSVRKMAASRRADLASLSQYAVSHPCGGRYFPNAVPSNHSLLESELSVHAQLCALFSDAGNHTLANDLRLWMMVQKETQQWDSDPAFLEALAAVLEAPGTLLDSRVLSLSASASRPFSSIMAAGNGFRIACRYFRDDRELQPGDSLSVGDHIRSECRIWNEENRSFVRIRVPRPALLRPVDQLSRPYGWWLSPLTLPSGYRCVPQGYRSVFSDGSEYRFDSYPEGETYLTEDYFVTQEGRFQCAVAEVESQYAPHYRGNSAELGLFR